MSHSDLRAVLHPPVEALANRFWTTLHDRVTTHMTENQDPGHPRIAVITIPVCGSSPPVLGPLTGVGLTFNARIAGYQIWSLVPGAVTVDIELSTPITHLTTGVPDLTITGNPLHFPSIVGDPLLGTGAPLPALNGIYSENLDTTLWLARDIPAGNMLHIWINATDGAILYTTMMLYLQDLDEVVTSS